MNYRSYNQLIKDTKDLISNLPNKYDLIISLPRSGNIPANIIGFHFNIKVKTIYEFINDPTFSNSLTTRDISDKPIKNVLVVDDTILSGFTMKKAKALLSSYDYNFEYAVVYTNERTDAVDHYQWTVPTPRLFECYSR